MVGETATPDVFVRAALIVRVATEFATVPGVPKPPPVAGVPSVIVIVWFVALYATVEPVKSSGLSDEPVEVT